MGPDPAGPTGTGGNVKSYTIDMIEPEASESTGEIFNEDRAGMVAPLVATFEAAYYWGPEELATVCQDLISDVFHLLHLENVDPTGVVEAALGMFREELEIEAHEEEE